MHLARVRAAPEYRSPGGFPSRRPAGHMGSRAATSLIRVARAASGDAPGPKKTGWRKKQACGDRPP